MNMSGSREGKKGGRLMPSHWAAVAGVQRDSQGQAMGTLEHRGLGFIPSATDFWAGEWLDLIYIVKGSLSLCMEKWPYGWQSGSTETVAGFMQLGDRGLSSGGGGRGEKWWQVAGLRVCSKGRAHTVAQLAHAELGLNPTICWEQSPATSQSACVFLLMKSK